MSSVVIVGAGITGLTAAYELHRLGLRPIVVEATARAGGLILTERTGGYTIEAGADSMLAQKPAAIELCEELGLSSRLQEVRPPGGAFVLRGSSLYALPKPSVLGIPQTRSALLHYDLLPVTARARMAVEPLLPRRANDDESVASFFRRRFGAATVDLIAQPLLGGIHAGDIEQLSLRALFPRLADAERRDGRVMHLGRRPADPPSTSAEMGRAGFRSLQGGMATLVTSLERALPGDTVQYERPIEQIARTSSGWRVRAGRGTFDARSVIVAAPAFVVSALLAPLDAEAARLCAAVPYVSTASIALAWPRAAIAHPLSGTGFVVARGHSDARITACTWVSSKWDERAPEGYALLRSFAGGAHDPAVVDLSDDELIGIARRDLGRVLGITDAPVLSRVYRWRNAGAQHTVGHLARMDALERRLADHPGLFVAGSGFRAIGIPDCVADARAAARGAAAFVRALNSSA